MLDAKRSMVHRDPRAVSLIVMAQRSIAIRTGTRVGRDRLRDGSSRKIWRLDGGGE